MTADPYPQDLAELDAQPFAPTTLEPMVEVPLIREVARIATALEQIALALLDRPTASVQRPTAPGGTLAALPPVQAVPQGQADVCPIHNAPWKTVPAGVSKKTGKEYSAFRACSVAGCDQRPRI